MAGALQILFLAVRPPHELAGSRVKLLKQPDGMLQPEPDDYVGVETRDGRHVFIKAGYLEWPPLPRAPRMHVPLHLIDKWGA